MTTKVCSKCGIEKLYSEFPKSKQCKDGLLGYCKSCKSKQDKEYSATYRIENKEKEKKRHAKYNLEHKEEHKIKGKKYRREHPEIAQEYYLRNKEKITQHNKEWYLDNREERLEKSKEYYLTHKEQHKENTRKYRETHRDTLREGKRKWKRTPVGKENEKRYYKKNKEKILKKAHDYYSDHVDEHTERAMKWAKENPDKVKVISQRYKQTPHGKIMDKNHQHRRREQMEHGDGITLKQWIKILDIQNHRCNECGRKFGKRLKATEDHIIPLSKGGLHEFENIQALCGRCNSTKNANLDKEYIHTWITEGVSLV